MKLIAIIPARTNSKRLPMKNFKQFFGKPIIKWVLDEVVKSELFDKIIVSCERGNLHNIIPHEITVHYRSKSLTKDTVTVDEVCLEVLKEHPDYDYLCCIYPTAYTVTWQDLCKSFKEMIKHDCDFNCSVNMINYDGHEEYGKNLDNGGFYWANIKTFLKEKKLIGINQYSYKLPMIDINTMQDFAEAKLHALTLPCGRFKA